MYYLRAKPYIYNNDQSLKMKSNGYDTVWTEQFENLEAERIILSGKRCIFRVVKLSLNI